MSCVSWHRSHGRNLARLRRTLNAAARSLLTAIDVLRRFHEKRETCRLPHPRQHHAASQRRRDRSSEHGGRPLPISPTATSTSTWRRSRAVPAAVLQRPPRWATCSPARPSQTQHGGECCSRSRLTESEWRLAFREDKGARAESTHQRTVCSPQALRPAFVSALAKVCILQPVAARGTAARRFGP